jgi:hypothetical protein
MPDSMESRVAVNSDNIAKLEREHDRCRERIHRLESTVSGVGLLSRAVEELQADMPNLARRAAREAVAEDRRARHRDFFSNLRTYAAVASVGIAFGGLIVALVLR